MSESKELKRKLYEIRELTENLIESVEKGLSDEIPVYLTYFKSSGKYYDSSEYYAQRGTPLYKIWEHVESLRDSGNLPGLVRGAREYAIIINVPDHEHSHPHLIPFKSYSN